MRTLAIGDIHGNRAALEALIEAVQIQSNDLLIFLGDYIDRGPDSKGVITCLIELNREHDVVPLRGNHEVMMLAARDNPLQANLWRSYRGDDLLRSYGDEYRRDWRSLIPAEHWEFVESTRPWFETDTHIFVHATLDPHLDLAEQPDSALYWVKLDPEIRHKSGKTIVCGHTPQRSGWPYRGPGAICLDTGAGHGLWLTCLDIHSGRFWQANERRVVRTGRLIRST